MPSYKPCSKKYWFIICVPIPIQHYKNMACCPPQAWAGQNFYEKFSLGGPKFGVGGGEQGSEDLEKIT